MHDDRRMRPVRGGHRGHEIGDAGAVLRDADAVPAGHARIAVGHVAAALLVRAPEMNRMPASGKRSSASM